MSLSRYDPTMDTPTTGGPGQQQRPRMTRVMNTICKQWLYIGSAIFLATLNLLLGIMTLSYLHPKKDALIFGIFCFGILIALAHFASLCYLMQRAKNESSDPTLVDAAYAVGVVLLFAISGIALTVELPGTCYSGPNSHLEAIGRGTCNTLTTMAVSSWLAFLLLIIATSIIFIAARRAIEFAKLPPPVFPSGAEAPVMRWLDRNDPFLAVHERRQQQYV
ncbi:hypothetical protein M413DRAFT_244038 [Hebeloma cylindrosporum]|uniref:MARVEL domain-containing protein n=1 Tax=Hebeloma cylindrosporum TaxID=76867 RepID=A0A0C2YCA7_HEBCY|nr:hypothetical protein M413DRAFT_244038 [Hebeloma cylindrosporum h7]